MKERIKILLTGAGAPGAGSIVECLRNNGESEVEIIGADKSANINTKKIFDRIYRVPSAEDPNFIKVLKEICIKEKIDIVVPIVTKELIKLAKVKREFKELGIIINVLDYNTLNIVNDKLKLFNYLKEQGFTTPVFCEIKKIDDIRKNAQNFGYPMNNVVLKQTCGNGSRGIRVLSEKMSRFDLFFNEKPNSMVCTLDDMVSILSEKDIIPTMMLMEYLPGNEWGVDVLAKEGEISNIMCRKTTVVQHSITMECQTESNEQIENFCKSVVKSLKITGNIGFDFKEDCDGNAKIMEINPRLTATVAINNVAGINFPWLGIKQAFGEKVEHVEKIRNVRMNRRYKEEYQYID